MSFLVTWPRRQISGISHLGSALPVAADGRRNQVVSRGPGVLIARRLAVGGLAAAGGPGAVPRRRAARTSSNSSSGSGRRARCRRISAAAIVLGERLASRSAGQRQVLLGCGVSVRIGSSSSRCWSRGADLARRSAGRDHVGLDAGRGEQLLGLRGAGCRAPAAPRRPCARPGRCGRCGAAARPCWLRQVGVDDQAEVRQVEPARGHVGGDADPGAAVAQRLQRVGALLLAELAGQRDGGEAALAQGCRAGGAPPRGWRRTPARRAPRSSAAR